MEWIKSLFRKSMEVFGQPLVRKFTAAPDEKTASSISPSTAGDVVRVIILLIFSSLELNPLPPVLISSAMVIAKSRQWLNRIAVWKNID
jgi:hypothetical protein